MGKISFFWLKITKFEKSILWALIIEKYTNNMNEILHSCFTIICSCAYPISIKIETFILGKIPVFFSENHKFWKFNINFIAPIFKKYTTNINDIMHSCPPSYVVFHEIYKLTFGKNLSSLPKNQTFFIFQFSEQPIFKSVQPKSILYCLAVHYHINWCVSFFI